MMKAISFIFDFGFIFNWSPGKDMNFESANFKLTKEFIKILGGNAHAEPYQLFVQKTIQGQRNKV